MNIPQDSNRSSSTLWCLNIGQTNLALSFRKRTDWISGETNTVQMTIQNPRKKSLDWRPLSSGRSPEDALPLPVKSRLNPSRVVKMPLELPPDAPDGLPIDLSATLREHRSEIGLELAFRVNVHSTVHL